jgi:hypothetical protein
MNLQVDALVATIISSIAIVASAIFVVVQLRQAARDRYFTITSHLFEIWQSPEFHLNQLRFAGLVSSRRASRSIIYSANFKAMNDLLAYMTEN